MPRDIREDLVGAGFTYSQAEALASLDIGGTASTGSIVVAETTFSAINSAIAYSKAHGYLDVVVPAGTYVAADGEYIDLTAVNDPTYGQQLIPKLIASGRVVLDSSAYTTNIPSVLIKTSFTLGVPNSANACISYMSGFTLKGNQTYSIGVENRGVSFYEVRDCRFGGLAEGIRCSGTGNFPAVNSYFTEGFIARNCKFRVDCQVHFRYYLLPGTGSAAASSHGSGLVDTVHALGPDNPAIRIDTGINAYNCPLYCRLQGGSPTTGTQNGHVFIGNDTISSHPSPRFFGRLTYEAFQNIANKIILALSRGSTRGFVYFSGPIVGIGGTRGNGFVSTSTNILGMRRGDLICTPYSNGTNIATTNAGRTDGNPQVDLMPGTTTLIGDVNGNTRVKVIVQATNYYWVWQGECSADFTGSGGGVFGASDMSRSLDTAGYGAPVFSITNAGAFQLTNLNYPMAGVTCFVSYEQTLEQTYSTITTSSTLTMNSSWVDNHLFTNTDVSGDVITLDQTGGLFQASPVVFRLVTAVGGTDGSIAGLVDGGAYYAIILSGVTLKLATTPANAIAGTAISLGAVVAGTGSWSFAISG